MTNTPSFTENTEVGCIEAWLNNRWIASITKTEKAWIVEWGLGGDWFTRYFPTYQAAEEWLTSNADDVADGVDL